jgi:hypothetical protein
MYIWWRFSNLATLNVTVFLFTVIHGISFIALLSLMLTLPAPVFRNSGGYFRHPPPRRSTIPFHEPLPLNATSRSTRLFSGA